MSTEKKSFMDSMMGFVDKIAGPLTAFGNIPFVRAVVAGMAGSIGVTMIGSIALIVYLLCSDGGLTANALIPFMKPLAPKIVLIQSLSMGIMGIYIVVAMGAEYAGIKGFSKTTGAVGALFAFFLLNYNEMGTMLNTAATTLEEAGAGSGLSTAYWGAGGIITAMVATAISINIIDFCYKRNIKITLPDSVPPAISDSFSAIIPYFFVALICWGIRTLLNFNIAEWITTILLPVLGAADNVFMYTFQQFLSALLWSAGLHGDNITGAVTSGFLTTWTLENQEAALAGTAVKDLPHVWTSNLCRLGQWVSTCWPLLILMWKDSKKVPQFKPLATISLPPAIFCIIEPIMFGLPIMLNPFLIIPFIVAHTLAAVLTYLATAVGFIGKMYISLPWATPSPILGLLGSGFSIGGFVWPFIMCAMGLVIFWPFWNAFVKDEQRKMAEAEAQSE